MKTGPGSAAHSPYGVRQRIADSIRERIARLEPAARGPIAAGVKAYLASRPVYRFKDDVKGFVFKAAITDVRLFDRFEGADGLSLAVEVTLQPTDKSFTDEQIGEISRRILAAAEKLGARLRT